MMALEFLPITALVREAGPLFSGGAETSGAWFSALARATLGPGEEPFLAAVKGRTGLVSALPLVRSPCGSWRALTAPYSTMFGPSALSGADAYALGMSLGRAVSRRLELDALDIGLATTKAFLDGLAQSGLVTTSYRHFANWYENIGSFESFWATRPARLKETVRRKGQRIAGAGGVFQILSTPQEMEIGMISYGAIYSDSGKVAEPHPDFMHSMITSLALRGDIRMGLLVIDGEAVAVQLWLLRDKAATIFKLAHRQKFSAFSPGTLLTHWMFSQLVPALKIRRVDFGRGDDDYKRDWLRLCTFRKGFIACNPTNLAGLRSIATDILPTWAGRIIPWRSATA